MSEKSSSNITQLRFSNFYFQCIAFVTALAPIVFSESRLTLRILFFIFIWWGWLAAAQLMPVIPEFSSEKLWISSLWKRGGWTRAESCIAAIIYLPIFVPKIFYFWAALFAAAIHYAFLYIGK